MQFVLYLPFRSTIRPPRFARRLGPSFVQFSTAVGFGRKEPVAVHAPEREHCCSRFECPIAKTSPAAWYLQRPGSTSIYTLSLHDALPISARNRLLPGRALGALAQSRSPFSKSS